jgi:predicted TIM-barrel fold metal-dependent hydrolase
MIFDCHAHLISGDTDRYPPAPLSGQLRAGDLDDPMTAERLLREMDAAGVARAVLVQRSHVYGFDNSYVCDAARAWPDRFAAVCSIDAAKPDAADRVRYWVGERGAAGVRMMEPFKGADASWFASEACLPMWAAATELGVSVCVHFFRWNRDFGLPALKGVLDRFPDTTVVIDHFSNMASEAGPPDYGVDDLLLQVAAFPKVYTKFTTIPLGQLRTLGVDAAPVVERVVQAFGAARVMWGSDIAQSAGSYAEMVELGLDATRTLDGAERAQVLNGATAAVYGGG